MAIVFPCLANILEAKEVSKQVKNYCAYNRQKSQAERFKWGVEINAHAVCYHLLRTVECVVSSEGTDTGNIGQPTGI